MDLSEDDEALLSLWRGRLFAVAYAATGGRYDDAQDALARALARIIRHRSSLRDPERFGAWARQIVRREAQRTPARPESPLSESHPAPTADPDLTLDVAAALRALPASLALTCVLHYRDGLTVAEVAARLGVAEGTVKWRLSEGRARLRHALKGYAPMETRTAALIAPDLDPSVRAALADALRAAGASQIVHVAAFADALALASQEIAVVVVGERIGRHAAFELLPILRQSADCRLWLLLDPGRTEPERAAAAQAAYIVGVDLLLNLPADDATLAAFARRALSPPA